MEIMAYATCSAGKSLGIHETRVPKASVKARVHVSVTTVSFVGCQKWSPLPTFRIRRLPTSSYWSFSAKASNASREDFEQLASSSSRNGDAIEVCEVSTAMFITSIATARIFGILLSESKPPMPAQQYSTQLMEDWCQPDNRLERGCKEPELSDLCL